MEKVICRYCGAEAVLESSAKVYRGKDYGFMYICRNWPECDSYVGTHKATGKPLGIMANPELRELKKMCHLAFDPFWKSGVMSRKRSYRKLQEIMSLPPEKAHIAMFDENQCRKLLDKLETDEDLIAIYQGERKRRAELDLRVPFD